MWKIWASQTEAWIYLWLALYVRAWNILSLSEDHWLLLLSAKLRKLWMDIVNLSEARRHGNEISTAVQQYTVFPFHPMSKCTLVCHLSHLVSQQFFWNSSLNIYYCVSSTLPLQNPSYQPQFFSSPLQYIRYLEENEGSEEEIRSVYHRACIIHLREKFRPHLSWAAFEEEKGIVVLLTTSSCSSSSMNINVVMGIEVVRLKVSTTMASDTLVFRNNNGCEEVIVLVLV